MSKVNALYHLVFCTKYREMTINPSHQEDLYRFIWSELQNHKCTLIRIGGIPNHIHMLVDLSPTVALSDLMRDIKANSAGWIKRTGFFPKFRGWAREYFGATLAQPTKGAVIEYIKRQAEHHNIRTFDEELRQMMQAATLQYHEADMTE